MMTSQTSNKQPSLMMEGVSAKHVVQKYITHKKNQSSIVIHPDSSSHSVILLKPGESVEQKNSQQIQTEPEFLGKKEKNSNHIIVMAKQNKHSQLHLATQENAVKSLLGELIEDSHIGHQEYQSRTYGIKANESNISGQPESMMVTRELRHSPEHTLLDASCKEIPNYINNL